MAKLRIVNGYLEINYSDGYVHISLPYYNDSIYATPDIVAKVRQYHRQNSSAFSWPDMFYDESRAIWTPFNEVSLKESNERVELERFILYCRGNQNVS